MLIVKGKQHGNKTPSMDKYQQKLLIDFMFKGISNKSTLDFRYCINRMKEEEDETETENNKLYALLWRTDAWVME